MYSAMNNAILILVLELPAGLYFGSKNSIPSYPIANKGILSVAIQWW